MNDDTLGRALEALYAQDVTALYARLSAQAIHRLGLECRFGQLDSTRFHVDGEYNRGEESEAKRIHITRGYSRDRRPDLNQVVLDLMTEHQAGLPLFMKPLSGNSEDKTQFKQVVEAHLDQLRKAMAIEYLVADSALYTEATLKSLGARMVMTLCLLVYSALEYRIRQALHLHGQSFPDQKGKPTATPTARWVFQCFVGIHVLIVNENQERVLNLENPHQRLLALLGTAYEAIYSKKRSEGCGKSDGR